MDDDLAERLRKAGLVFRPWPAVGADAFRFVSGWNSPIEAIRTLPETL
jgi:threonine aldolase